MEIKVEKKVDDSFKNKAEEEKKEQINEQPKSKQLKDILKEVVESDWKRDYEIYPHQQVMIVTYDPMMRTVGIKHVQNVVSKTDVMNILRDSIFQLEQMEMVTRMTHVTEQIVTEHTARAVGTILGSTRK